MPIEDVDDLFGVTPEEFVRARDQFAKQLRGQGRADEAAEVKRLRRPSVVVWSLNQVARRHPDEVAALLTAGNEVRAAQRNRAGERLREARKELQARVTRVAGKAMSFGGREADLEAALRAAALGGDAAGELREGRLQQVPEAPTGLEMWTAGADGDSEPSRSEDRPRKQLQEARAAHRQAEADAERARAALERAEARVDELEARLDRERAALGEARDRVEDAERRAGEAKREVARLERKAGER